jgi:hypothetical protein
MESREEVALRTFERFGLAFLEFDIAREACELLASITCTEACHEEAQTKMCAEVLKICTRVVQRG